MSQHELIVYPECWGHRGVGNVVLSVSSSSSNVE